MGIGVSDRKINMLIRLHNTKPDITVWIDNASGNTDKFGKDEVYNTLMKSLLSIGKNE